MNERDRGQVLERVVETVERKFVDPALNGVDFRATANNAKDLIIRADSTEAFEREMNVLLQKLGASHTGFFHERKPRSPSRVAISATFLDAETSDGRRWVFQDVHPGGIAADAGIRPGDILLTIDKQEIAPPAVPLFAFGQRYLASIRRWDGDVSHVSLAVPASSDKKRPLIVPKQVVTSSRLLDGIGHLRVSMFPGMLGIDVARDMSQAVEALNTDRLIIDLRGNTGGGIGCLRLMSLLCADRRGVGFSVGRSRIEAGYRKENLPQFDRIPSNKLGIIPLVFRFARAKRSVALVTEALGSRRHHGRVAMLVNEHSASASEMVAAFAADENLATLVGQPTPGRLVGANSFKVGHGYRIALPVVKYFTWRDQPLEGIGITPSIVVKPDVPALREGRDVQLAAAINALA